MADELFLIRHGELPKEFAGRYVGSTDPGLSPEGRESCRALSALRCDAVYSSPLKRAMETARWIPAPLFIDDDLREIDFGEWENLTFEEISARITPEHLELWTKEPDKMYFPGGERAEEFDARADAAFARIASLPLASVAIVTHGGVLMRILSRLRGKPGYACLPPRGGMVHLIQVEGKWHEK